MHWKNKLFIVLTCWIVSDTVFAQSQRLTGHWEFLKGDIGGIWEAIRLYKKGDPESVPIWSNVTLPHCVNAEDAVDPDVNYYQGPMWYRTQLDIHNPHKNGHTLLHFEGAGQKMEVYVYDSLVASHVGGYDEWDADITDAARRFLRNDSLARLYKNKVPISIRCDNSRDIQMIPSNMSDFTIYGGLYRYVDLIYQPETYLDQLLVTPTVDTTGKKGSMAIQYRLNKIDASYSSQIVFRIKDPNGKEVIKITAKTDASGKGLLSIPFSCPIIWSTDNPRLYTVETTLQYDIIKDTMTMKVGFRNFKFQDHGPFYLNGKRLLLRGTHRHEDHAGVGAAMTENMIRKEFILIKDMGVNFIRLAHYQQSSIVLNLCDSLGILVWEEIPWCRGGLGGSIYQEQGIRMLSNMIHQHYNHPAVIIWGLGNENDWPGDFNTFDRDSIRKYMITLNNLAHKLDTTRKTAIRRCDFCKDIVDIYSPSIWAGWYRGLYTEYKDITKSEFEKVNHFLHVEWGGDSHAGRNSENPDKALQAIKATGSADERAGDASLYGGAARASKDGDWSESYICNLFDWHLKEQENMPWLTGSAAWVFKDFSTPVRPDNPIPYVNQKGVVERDLNPKESYYVFQSYWTEWPMVHIFSHNWPVRWGGEGEEKMIKVYSNCSEVELFVNNKSYGVKKRNSQNYPAAGLRWNVPLFQGSYQVIAKGKKEGVIIEDTILFKYQSDTWGKPAIVKLHQLGDENGIATIEATVWDEKGVQCLDADNFIRFKLAGEGNLIANQGTSSGSDKVQLYNGRADIKVRKKGKCVLSGIVALPIPTAFLELE